MLSRRLTTFWYSILFICFYDYINLSSPTICCCLSGDLFRNFINHSMFTDMWTQSNMSPIYNYPTNIRLDEEMKKMKKSWRLLSSASSEDVLVKTNIFLLVIRLQDVFKRFSRCLQDAFKTSCQDVFKASCKSFFKTSSRRLAKTSFQNFFKTSCKNIFKKSFLRRIIKLNCSC